MVYGPLPTHRQDSSIRQASAGVIPQCWQCPFPDLFRSVEAVSSSQGESKPVTGLDHPLLSSVMFVTGVFAGKCVVY